MPNLLSVGMGGSFFVWALPPDQSGPGPEVPRGIAPKVTESYKPRHHTKVMTYGEDGCNGNQNVIASYPRGHYWAIGQHFCHDLAWRFVKWHGLF